MPGGVGGAAPRGVPLSRSSAQLSRPPPVLRTAGMRAEPAAAVGQKPRPRRSYRAPRRVRLLRGGPCRFDKPRYPLISVLQAVPVHRLKLSEGKGVCGGALKKRLHPCLQPRELLDMSELLDSVEEVVALQERRVGGIDQ